MVEAGGTSSDNIFGPGATETVSGSSYGDTFSGSQALLIVASGGVASNAEGAPAETYLDDDSRGLFQSAQGTPGTAAIACAPRHAEGFEIEAIRRRLAAGLSANRHATR